MDPLAHLVVSMTGHGRAALYSDPLGVCLIIGAWNYPLHLTLLPVVGAIAAGNAVMIKTPSPKYSPATAALIADIIPKYLDPSCVMVVEGGREGTEAVLQPRFDHIFFTGGSYVGKMVAKAAAKHLTPTVLELGGKSPCIVDKSADLGVVARRMMWGKFTNAGQTCVAADHCYVHQSVAGRFVEECKKALLEFYGEDASQSPDLARIINTRAWEVLIITLTLNLNLTQLGDTGRCGRRWQALCRLWRYVWFFEGSIHRADLARLRLQQTGVAELEGHGRGNFRADFADPAL